ncbi:MAG: rubrerythrin family protein [Candidatus Riflebacteria bacterium]|nr:rubrerythrin family protein [Candidatus Riflebacteria bacterium]
MHKMTVEFLMNAFAGESQAHVKYAIFAEECEKKGHKNLANMFKAISHAEYVHARGHFLAVGKLGDTAMNLQTALDGENFEIDEMYPVYHEAAKFQQEKDAVRTTKYAMEAEKIHANMYAKALELVKSGKDYPAAKVHICEICGHTVENEAPDKCPVCNAKKDFFRCFSA